MNFHEIGHWVESHPYYTAAGVFAVGVAIVLIYNATGSGSGPPLSIADQLKLVKAQFAGQRSLITAQNQPALAAARSQTAQANVAARSNTEQARLAANAQDTAAKLNSTDVLTEAKYQQQEMNYQTEVQAFIAEMTGWDNSPAGQQSPWSSPYPLPLPFQGDIASWNPQGETLFNTMH